MNNSELRQILIEGIKSHIKVGELSHDIDHSLRVLVNAEKIQAKEGGNYFIVAAAALFHDSVSYPKDSPQAKQSPEESSDNLIRFLKSRDLGTKDDYNHLHEIITTISYSRNKELTDLEAQIVYDADKLESSGAIAIARTFISAGIMSRPIYNTEDPFLKSGRPADEFKYSLDFIINRLLKIESRLYTSTAKELVRSRSEFIKTFLKQIEFETSDLPL